MAERKIPQGKYFKMVGSQWVPMTDEEIATPLAEKVTGLPLARPAEKKLQPAVGRRGHDIGMHIKPQHS